MKDAALRIMSQAIEAVLPDVVVSRALEGRIFTGSVYVVAAGKAAWRMAHAALGVLGDVAGGVVATKYGHARGCLSRWNA